MFTLILGLLLWTPAIIGWGFPSCVVRKKLAPSECLSSISFAEPVTGFVLIAGFVILINFWVPISNEIGLLALLIGWLGFIWRMKRYGKPAMDWRLIVLGIVWLIGVALLSSSPIKNYDAGLYHVQSIMWLKENPAPFGLANLHGRLGFNSSWFALASVVDLPYGGANYSLLPALLIWLWGVACINSMLNLLNDGVSGRFHDLFAILTPVVFLSGVLHVNLSSPAPDLPVLLLTLLLVFLALKVEPPQTLGYQIWISLATAILAITIKLSAIPLLLMPLGLLLVGLWHKKIKIDRDDGFIFLVFPLVLSMLWVIRNVVLSGCLAYPVNSTCLHFLSWSVPQAQVEAEAAGILSWARAPWNYQPHEVLENWNWLASWLVNLLNSDEFRGIMVTWLLGVIMCAIAKIVSKNNGLMLSTTFTLSILPMAISVLGVVYWFAIAPDIRFGAGYWWSLVLLILCNAVYGLLNCKPLVKVAYWQFIRASLVSLVIVFVLSALFTRILGRIVQMVADPQTLVTTAPVPMPRSDMLQTIDSVNIYQPINADQCWEIALPCTPGFNETLRVIKNSSGQFAAFFYPK